MLLRMSAWHVEFSLDSLQERLVYENDRCEMLPVVSAMVQPPRCQIQLVFSGFVFFTKLKIFQSETLSTLSKTVAFNTSTQICRTSRVYNDKKYANTVHEEVCHSVVVTFSQIML